MFNKKNQQPRQPRTRVNMQIRVPSVRVRMDGKDLGIMNTSAAQRLADEDGLDLIEIVPQAQPPVCLIADYGKYKYEINIKEKEARRKQRESLVETKEVRFRTRINDHDIDVKVASINRFIKEGNKVALSLEFKNREITHKEEGFQVMKKVMGMIQEWVTVEKNLSMEGRRITARVAPKE